MQPESTIGSAQQQLFIRTMSWEAEGVLSIELARQDGADLPAFECGAHIDLVLGAGLIRQYSICSEPSVRDQWTIAVLREPESRGGSRYVHETLRPGMKVSVVGPRSNFRLIAAEQYLFIAGGIGVTPLIPMIRQVSTGNKDWRVLYGGRRRSSMAFVDRLVEMGPAVTIAPEDETGLLDLEGAISRLRSDAAVYCCGPEGLISAVEATCLALGRPAPHVERFGARPKMIDEVRDDADDQPFEVVLCESGRRFTVPRGKTIVEVLREAGIPIVTSCEEGFCGVCETEVIGGIPDHRDEYLESQQRATNSRMMICVGRSKTPELILRK